MWEYYTHIFKGYSKVDINLKYITYKTSFDFEN